MRHLSFKKKGQVFGLDGLQGFVLLIVLVGMLIGIGVLTTEKFSAITYYTRTNYNDTVTVANYTAQALDYGNVSNVVVWNGTVNQLPSFCYSVNATDGHFIFDNETSGNCGVIVSSFYVIYDFKEYATATRTAMGSIGSEISGIATNWMGLIVTLAILAIILGLVLVAFRPGMDRG